MKKELTECKLFVDLNAQSEDNRASNKETDMMIQDRKTGQWYDPEVKFKELLAQQWFIDIMKRLKER